MRSERLLRLGDRLGAIIIVSMTVLGIEVVIGATVLFMWSPSLTYTPGTIFALLLLVPVSAVAGTAVGALLSVAVVAPLLMLADWTGRRIEGRASWYWVPAVTAAVTVLPVLGGAAELGAGPLWSPVCWLAATAGLTVPALVSRRLLLTDRPYVSGGALFGWVALYGTLALVTAFALTGFALWAGVGDEPPRSNTVQSAGTWTDGTAGGRP
ncbi:hypothetical protein [Streptomyces sp. NPDC048623]|uniref:hypothetical protein n=1 Tax=Streptomyces sp. NPDC048623 TaxID=3155761 RepID=UPI00343854DF